MIWDTIQRGMLLCLDDIHYSWMSNRHKKFAARISREHEIIDKFLNLGLLNDHDEKV